MNAAERETLRLFVVSLCDMAAHPGVHRVARAAYQLCAAELTRSFLGEAPPPLADLQRDLLETR